MPQTADLAAVPVLLSVNGEVRSRGRGADALGDPRQALAWLAAAHAVTAAPLRAGQVVITGVCGMPVAVRPGDLVRARFGDLGEVCARLL